MSSVSEKYIKSPHAGVHDQFDFGYAAILACEKLTLDGYEDLNSSLGKKLAKFAIKEAMSQQGIKHGFIKNRLALEAFLYISSLSHLVFSYGAGHDYKLKFFLKLTIDLAEFLDEQFASEGKADTIQFLKIKCESY